MSTVERNHITRPAAWQGVIGAKNPFELKNARRVLVEGNVLERNWISAQDGCEHAMVKDDGSCNFCNAPRGEVISAIARRTERR